MFKIKCVRGYFLGRAFLAYAHKMAGAAPGGAGAVRARVDVDVGVSVRERCPPGVGRGHRGGSLG